jgi:hypothetical protein
MKRKSEPNPAWVVDYTAGRGDAIRWLGDRYLLAKPINGKHDSWRETLHESDADCSRREVK